MKKTTRPAWIPAGSALLAAAGLSVALMGSAYAGTSKVDLVGSNEVPPVTGTATGTGSITINDDKTVSGSVTTTGLTGTVAHIHDGAVGSNGPVIVPLAKSGDTYSVPAGAKLTDEQYADYKAGKLYVNVHSADHPGGAMRAQIAP